MAKNKTDLAAVISWFTGLSAEEKAAVGASPTSADGLKKVISAYERAQAIDGDNGNAEAKPREWEEKAVVCYVRKGSDIVASIFGRGKADKAGREALNLLRQSAEVNKLLGTFIGWVEVAADSVAFLPDYTESTAVVADDSFAEDLAGAAQ